MCANRDSKLTPKAPVGASCPGGEKVSMRGINDRSVTCETAESGGALALPFGTERMFVASEVCALAAGLDSVAGGESNESNE